MGSTYLEDDVEGIRVNGRSTKAVQSRTRLVTHTSSPVLGRRADSRRHKHALGNADGLMMTLGLCRFLNARGEGFRADGNPRRIPQRPRGTGRRGGRITMFGIAGQLCSILD